MSKELIFSVTLKDCDVQTFKSGGPGGQHQNTTNSGVRVIHRESGARGECREERSQHLNKRKAFKRMAESSTFQAWLKVKLGREDAVKAQVERDLWPAHLRVEVREAGHWVPMNGQS